MNAQQAKKMLPIIAAFAEGKTIQLLQDKWEDIDAHNDIGFNCEPSRYRIKPEKKSFWLNIYEHAASTVAHPSKVSADSCAKDAASYGGKRIACVEVTYEEGQGL
jgi:hypothetical protein